MNRFAPGKGAVDTYAFTPGIPAPLDEGRSCARPEFTYKTIRTPKIIQNSHPSTAKWLIVAAHSHSQKDHVSSTGVPRSGKSYLLSFMHTRPSGNDSRAVGRTWLRLQRRESISVARCCKLNLLWSMAMAGNGRGISQYFTWTWSQASSSSWWERWPLTIRSRGEDVPK